MDCGYPFRAFNTRNWKALNTSHSTPIRHPKGITFSLPRHAVDKLIEHTQSHSWPAPDWQPLLVAAWQKVNRMNGELYNYTAHWQTAHGLCRRHTFPSPLLSFPSPPLLSPHLHGEAKSYCATQCERQSTTDEAQDQSYNRQLIVVGDPGTLWGEHCCPWLAHHHHTLQEDRS